MRLAFHPFRDRKFGAFGRAAALPGRAASKLRAGALAGLFFCLGSLAVAEPLLTDPFTDGSPTNARTAVGADALGGVWFKSAGTLAVADDAAGIGAGAALQFSGSDPRNLRAFFTAVTLTNPDDFIRVRLAVRFTSAPGNVDQALRFPPVAWAASARNCPATPRQSRPD